MPEALNVQPDGEQRCVNGCGTLKWQAQAHDTPGPRCSDPNWLHVLAAAMQLQLRLPLVESHRRSKRGAGVRHSQGDGGGISSSVQFRELDVPCMDLADKFRSAPAQRHLTPEPWP